MSHNFKELKIWKESMDLASDIYKMTKEFPRDERFGLISQIRRAAVSVPYNIAERVSRGSNKAFNQFLEIALGSLHEVETQLLIARNLQYINMNKHRSTLEKIIEIQKMIAGFKKTLIR
jgi:four helix bundle protein